MLRDDTSSHQPKTEQVTSLIRRSIVSGRFGPGLRLPTFAEMEGDFAVGRAVIQNAVETLKRDGFIRSDGRRGLFVTENPPHLYQYGLVMASSPGDPGYCQLTAALSNEAHRIEASDSQRRFRFYYGIRPGADRSQTVDALIDDVTNDRLAGLIVHRASADTLDVVLPAAVRVPRVYLWADQTSGVWPCLTTDGVQLLQRSLQLLKERGCSRVAIMHMSGVNTDIDHAEMFRAAGLDYHAPWVQWIGRSDPATADGLVSLLMDYRRDIRPDGLIVADDNLVPYVSSSLIAAGVRVGDELQLVAHCNWPWPPRSILPMVRIGFNVRTFLQRAVDAISQQQEGKPLEPYQRMPAQFEWEIDQQQV